MKSVNRSGAKHWVRFALARGSPLLTELCGVLRPKHGEHFLYSQGAQWEGTQLTQFNLATDPLVPLNRAKSREQGGAPAGVVSLSFPTS